VNIHEGLNLEVDVIDEGKHRSPFGCAKSEIERFINLEFRDTEISRIILQYPFEVVESFCQTFAKIIPKVLNRATPSDNRKRRSGSV